MEHNHSERIVERKLLRIKSRISNISLQRTPSVEEECQLKTFEECMKKNQEEALEIVVNCRSSVWCSEMLKITVDGRNNEFIFKVLNILRSKTFTNEDDTDGYLDQHKCCGKTRLREAVLHATINDDPETLAGLVSWARQEGLVERDPCEHAMELACLKEYNLCIKHLYDLNYRIRLPIEDEERITTIMKMNNLFNGFQFYYILTRGNKNPEENPTNLDRELLPITRSLSVQSRNERKKRRKYFNEEHDSVESYLSLKAYSNSHYLAVEFQHNSHLNNNQTQNNFSISEVDPLRKSLAIGRYAELLSRYDTLYTQEYHLISKRCEDFATDLLNNCENMTEVKTLLHHSPSSEDGHRHDNETWNIAMWNSHKKFVSHPFYQDFLWKKLCGNNFDWDKYYIKWKILYFILSVILPFTYPFIVLIDTLFRKNDLLFISPAETPAENKFFAFYRWAMHKPIFRIIFHHFLELIFLILVFLSTWDPLDTFHDKQIWFYDILLAVFVLSYVIDDIVGLRRRGWANFSSFWHTFNFINSIMFLLGMIVSYCSYKFLPNDNRATLSGNHNVNIGATVYSIAATFALLRPLRWLLFNKTLGPVVVCCIKVVKDVIHIIIIFMITFAAFSVGLYSMFKPFKPGFSNKNSNYTLHENKMVVLPGLIRTMFWILFDPGHPEQVTIRHCNRTQEDPDKPDYCPRGDRGEEDVEPEQVSYEFSHFMGIAMWGLYQVIIVIILTNILIAMMTTTYTNISKCADTEWKFSKSFYQVEFLASRAILPPPFRIFYHLATFKQNLCRGCFCVSQYENAEDYRVKTKYRDTLLNILESKLQADFEKSTQDDFNDLRKDMQNIIKETSTDQVLVLQETIVKLTLEIQNLKNQIAHNHTS